MLHILQNAHDKGGHWAKQGTLAKLKGQVYWPSMSTDVERYIKGCLQCALHGPALKSQLLCPIRVQRPFQLIGFDFIGPLPVTAKGYRHIFHVMDYLSRFSITFPMVTANAEDVIPALEKVFSLYARPAGIYCNRGQHFENSRVKTFLSELGIPITFSSSGAHQSTGMIEIGNRLLEDVLRKSRSKNCDWETILTRSTYSLNARIISHLGTSPSVILLGVTPDAPLIDSTFPNLDVRSATAWATQLRDPIQHRKIVLEFIQFRSQLHDVVRARSDQRKDAETVRFDRKIIPHTFSSGDLVVLYQEKTGKLEPRWRGPFAVEGFGGKHGITYQLRQLNGRRIRGTFHGNHLKQFTPRSGYLANPIIDPSILTYQTIRKPRAKGKQTRR